MVTIDATFNSNSSVVPSYHYRRRPARLTREPRGLLYVATASLGLALGTMTGVVVGIWTMPGVQASASRGVMAVSAQAPGIGTQPLASINPPPASAVVQVSQVAAQPLVVQVKRAHHRWFWSVRRNRWIRRHGASYAQLHPVQTSNVAAPKVAVAILTPAVFKQSVPDVVTGTGTFYAEGDATVVDFDAAAGTIQTYEGRTFAIGMATRPGNAISWEDYRANVHYRCDQSGNCTLARKGVVVRDAKLEL